MGFVRGRGRGASSSNPRRVTAREREVRALELRKAGHSFDAIARQLGYSHSSGAHAAVKRALERLPMPHAEEMRQLESERLDTILAGLWPQVEQGRTRAAEVAIAVSKRRADLFGLDAPARLVGGDGGPLEILIRYADHRADPAAPASGADDDQG